VKDISNIEYVLHHWRPIRIYTNKKDQKMVIIGYFDRKVNNSVRLSFIIFFILFYSIKESQGAKERLLEYFENGPGRECQIDHLYFEQRFVEYLLLIFCFIFFFEFRSQRWPIIINETSYEQIIGDENKPFYYDLFGMKFEANLQSYGITNLTAYEAIYAEILKLCNLEPTSTIFLQYFSDIGLF